MNVLVVSNMGPKKSAPVLGLFVNNQVKRLKHDISNLDYFYMRWNGDSFFHRLFKYPFFFFSFFISVVLNPKKIDLIHIHYYYPTILSAWLYKLLRNKHVKVVVTCHGGDIYCYQSPSQTYKKLICIVDHWIFTSKRLQQSFYAQNISYSILSAGFDESIYFQKTDIAKQYDVAFVGCLDHNKGTDRLEALVKACPEKSFIVIGMGPHLTRFLTLSKTYKNLTVTGALPADEVAKHLTQSRILISLSRNESFGLVMTEAMACGTPVIATKTHGSEEQLKGSAYLIEQSNESELISAFIKALNSVLSAESHEYQKLSENALAISNKYRLESICLEIEAIYRNLVAK
ncbi:glycosyltransferase family 4 protein [Pseudoalteromonas spongiae]|uniref:Glycosyltransferase family 4 protein n=1 Tax=Pseudoalteromonas spongiae TaxID=298657 RepID=A0ABU8ENB7_9GAMM